MPSERLASRSCTEGRTCRKRVMKSVARKQSEIPARVQRLLESLACPSCGGTDLDQQPEAVTCNQCGVTGALGPVVRYASLVSDCTDHAGQADSLDSLKDRVKRLLPGIYPALIQLASPVYAALRVKEFLTEFDLDSSLVLNLGSGVSRLHESIVNVDLRDYPEVDLQCPIGALPLSDNSVDGVVSIAVLEHVSNPQEIVQEIRRVLKPGGKVYCFIPFMQGVHASPDDFQRYTPHGLDELFRDFENREVTIGAGPSSGFTWLLQEWLALIFSLGSRRLYWVFYYLFFLVTPLKFLDVLLARHPMASNIASGFSITASKR